MWVINMRVSKPTTENRVEKCIGQVSYRAMTKKDIIDFIDSTYPDVADKDGNICVVTTIKSGSFDNPTYTQSVVFNRILSEKSDTTPI